MLHLLGICNTLHTAPYVAAPHHEELAPSLAPFPASNWPHVRTIRPWPCCDSKIQTAEGGGGGLFRCFYFSEQWHIPFQVAFKVVSIRCSRFWIFLCLLPAAPTLEEPVAIVLPLICTKVSSPAGRAEALPPLGGFTTLLSHVGDIFALLFWGWTEAAPGFCKLLPRAGGQQM